MTSTCHKAFVEGLEGSQTKYLLGIGQPVMIYYDDILFTMVNHGILFSSTDYGTDYFKKFSLVLNALDNRGVYILYIYAFKYIYIDSFA